MGDIDNTWDHHPAHLWKKLAKLIKRPPGSQVNVQEIARTADSVAATTANSPVLSSRDLLLISGAAAVGGALVVAVAYVTPVVFHKNRLQCPVCGCNCCACYVSHQRPVEAVKELFRKIGTSLNAGKKRLGQLVGTLYKDEEHTDNNGSWTCVQVLRDGTSTTSSDGIVETEMETATPALPDPFSPAKRKGYLSWDDYFMSIAFLSAQRSKDPARQVGACLVSQDYVILGIGYNGFPRGCSDDKLPWAKKSKDGDVLKTKYPYVCHAEVNAILNKNHASASGQRLYVTMFPCNECAKIIIQAGIAEVVFYTDKKTCPDFQFAASRRLLSLADVKVRQHQPQASSIVLEF